MLKKSSLKQEMKCTIGADGKPVAQNKCHTKLGLLRQGYKYSTPLVLKACLSVKALLRESARHFRERALAQPPSHRVLIRWGLPSSLCDANHHLVTLTEK
jgi:hypothetical protein